ncbi:hypothetical protein CYLTODRAFT_413161 [Cylindrobasidium torrendii FP15055 ss-10]|uniref:Uncharacterized protein n=1 Tax=Cylindrobasidium torrendii FP15055 ss-10 TaxID=1314674 RepID=A0A0D7B3E4_9AGAR|nr:hypothetical protein CYLTODRAFT_413161 [Cylindrobasidium torrendii FP15055 ss-10]
MFSYRAPSPTGSDSSSYSSSSSMLYVPVHKRSHSETSSTATTPLSGSPIESAFKHIEAKPRPRVPVYSFDELLAIRAYSPLVLDAVPEPRLDAIFAALPQLRKDPHFEDNALERSRSPRRRQPKAKKTPEKAAPQPLPAVSKPKKVAPAIEHKNKPQERKTTERKDVQTAHVFPQAFTRQRPGHRQQRGRTPLSFANEDVSWRHPHPVELHA